MNVAASLVVLLQIHKNEEMLLDETFFKRIIATMIKIHLKTTLQLIISSTK